MIFGIPPFSVLTFGWLYLWLLNKVENGRKCKKSNKLVLYFSIFDTKIKQKQKQTKIKK